MPLKIDGHFFKNKTNNTENNEYNNIDFNNTNKKENLIFKVIWEKRNTNELMAPSFYTYSILNKKYPNLVTNYIIEILSKKNYFQS